MRLLKVFIVLCIPIVLFLTMSCGGDHDHEESSTHIHADGTTHSHSDEEKAKSTHTHADGTTHSHDDEEEHSGSHTHADGTTHADHQTEAGTHTHADGTTHTHDTESTEKETIPPGYHIHPDGTVHADESHTDDKVDEQGRSYHVHADGTIHYSETSESRVDGNIIRIPANEMSKYGIGVTTAGPGMLQMKIRLSGEITVNADNMAHIVPRVPGIVREVRAKLGDVVKKGDVMAVIDSRELADAKADYLANMERFNLAQTNFDRKEKLWKDKITSEKEYLNSREKFAEAKINLRSAKQKLIAMGFTSAYLESLPMEADEAFTQFDIVAPFTGTVIEKHIALGEDLKDDSQVFIVADLSTVWINLQVYPKDLPLIQKGQTLCLEDHVCLPETQGTIDYIAPIVGKETRTAIARVVQPNPKGELRPGLFVNADVVIKTLDADILVRKEHIQYLDDVPCVFVQTAEGFEVRGVTLGDSDDAYAAITNGLAAGERYATANSFLLKSEMEQSHSGFHIHADGTVHIEKH